MCLKMLEFFFVCWITSSSLANSIHPSLHQSQSVPLLQFPFANFLANPCSFSSTSGSYNLALINRPMAASRLHNSLLIRLIDPSEHPLPEASPELSRQAIEFLNPFRDRYSGRNYTTEERQSLNQELNLALHETKHFNRRLYHPSVIRQCEGIQLQSLPNEPLYLYSTGEIRMEDVYRRLIIAAAHLHLMSHDSANFLHCPNENPSLHQKFRQLTGKLETLACLTLHSTVGSSERYSDGRKFFQVVHHLLQSSFQHNHDCSAREMMGCLVTRYVDRILNTIQHLYGQPPTSFPSYD